MHAMCTQLIRMGASADFSISSVYIYSFDVVPNENRTFECVSQREKFANQSINIVLCYIWLRFVYLRVYLLF